MGKIRIIGGEYRSRILEVADNIISLRPTPNRVRETLFNWLGQDLTGKNCLDVFAGSGALSFEALSRNAKHVVALEQNATAIKYLELNSTALKLDKSQITICKCDALTYLANVQISTQFDIIFVDAPYSSDLLSQSLALIKKLNILSSGGVVYVEYSHAPNLFGYIELKRSQASSVTYALLQLVTAEPMQL